MYIVASLRRQSVHTLLAMSRPALVMNAASVTAYAQKVHTYCPEVSTAGNNDAGCNH